MMDYTVDPPLYVVSDKRKQERFPYLTDANAKVNMIGQMTEHTFEIPKLVELTHALMDQLSIPYDNRRSGRDPSDPWYISPRSFDDFSEEEVKFYYPFAMMLSCLDGNSFSNPGNADHDLVRQYVPDAYLIMAYNRCGCSPEDRVAELKAMIDASSNAKV